MNEPAEIPVEQLTSRQARGRAQAAGRGGGGADIASHHQNDAPEMDDAYMMRCGAGWWRSRRRFRR